jgi:putative molybdopterin biosynthesis protein
VSAYFIMENIVKRLIEALQGIEGKDRKKVKAVVSRRVMSSLKYLEFVRVKLGYVGNKLIATPLSRGAGATMSLVNADGVIEVPQSIEGLESGTEVEVKLFRDEADIKNTVVCIGSHDPIIDIAGDLLHERKRNLFLSSAHVGSMGGIMALKNGETHIAPIHLLDMESGEYNLSYIKKYIPGRSMALIKGVKRIQGFLVPKGNPRGIKGFEDLIGDGLRFVNRQRGSGTRLLLDYYLKNLGINPENILGYDREEFTHLAVAAAVSSGDADAGLGVYSAALAMGLDFIPVGNEEYDFAVPEEYLETDMIKSFIETIKSSEFLSELNRMGGYDYSSTGSIVML